MAFHRLEVDDFGNDEFKLIAIHATIEDYRLAYLINKHLQLQLKRLDHDLDFINKNIRFSLYEYKNEAYQLSWHLISNLCKREEDVLYSAGSLFSKSDKVLKNFYLLNEFKNVEYFLKISEEIHQISETKIVQLLKQIPQIITCYSVNTNLIKSKDHLIF